MKKILIVNNDYDTMELLKNWLEKKNYEAKYTSSREEAFDIVKTFIPDLVLVDVLQKEVAEKLKADEEAKKIPVLLMTGYTLRQSNNKVPADDIIEKPFNLPLLQKKIEKLIQKRA